MKYNGKSILKKTAALMLSCLMVYGSFAVCAFAQGNENIPASPPEYMRALSELVKSTADESDFGRIELAVGSPEMSVDGNTQQISPDESQVPVIEDGEIKIPEEVLDIGEDNTAKKGRESAAEVPESDDTLLTVDELEARGYEVTCDNMSGTILITEPFQSMRLIVKTKTSDVKNTYGATTVIKVSNNKTVLQYASKEAAKSASEKLSADASVIFCEQDSLFSIQDAADGEAATSYKCWGTTRVGADEYMNSLPDASELNEVVVAVVDTGVDLDHPFLSGRIKDGGWDFVNNDDDPSDDHNHGTHCAGIITDATKSNVKILPFKVFNAEGSGYPSVIVEGVMYAVDSSADIINMSFGGGGNKEVFTDVITYASGRQVTCVAAAGNESLDLSISPRYPAVIPDVITVSSSGANDNISSFSNYGSVVDICAPGENILSSVNGGGYLKYSGTSMAAPLVAACAALLKSTDKDMTPDEVCAALCERANDRGAPGRDDYFGAGRVNLGAPRVLRHMSFEASAITLHTYEREYVRLSFYPEYPSDNTVTYINSNEEVAYVSSNGRIHGLKAGTAVITAVSSQGGFTDTLTVTVKKGDSGTFSKIVAGGNSVLLLKNDKTAYAYGFAYNNECGYYNMSQDYRYLFSVCEDPKIMITDIEDISTASSYTIFTRTDKTLWFVGSLTDTKTKKEIIFKKPVQVMMDDETPLTDIVEVSMGRALRDDGTVWVVRSVNGTCYGIHATKNGAIISGVKTLHGKNTAENDSSADQFDGETASAEDSTDIVDEHSRDSYSVILKKDGTVWVKGSNQYNKLGTPEVESSEEFIQVKTAKDTYLTGVTQISNNTYATYALREDGTVWSWGGFYEVVDDYPDYTYNEAGWLGIGPYYNEKIYASQVKIDANTPLTHVSELGEVYGARMIFILDDGNVWWTGVKRLLNENTADYDRTLYAEPFIIINGRQIYMGRDDTAEPYVNRNVTDVKLDKTVMSVKNGESFLLNASVLPHDATNKNIYWSTDNPEVAYISGDGTVTATGVGTAVIRVTSYEDSGIFAECRVAVEDENPIKLTLKRLPDKLTYSAGETINTDGGVICLAYANGVVKSMPIAASFCSGYDMSIPGNQHVTVTYAGFTVYYDITVNPAPTLTSVEIKQPPQKTEYLEGEKLDTRSGVLTVWYSDGTSKEVDITSGMCSGYDMQTTGSQTVTVSFSGKSCTYAISVREPAVTGIVLTALPNKLVYNSFDSILTDGGTIALRYENGKISTSVPISADMCSGYDMSKVGPQTVTVTYNGHSASYAIEVYNFGDAAYITMNTQPDQTYYYYNNQTTLDVTGGSIAVHYKDGSTENVALDNSMCSKIITVGLIPDPQVVTVTYYSMTTTFEIRNIKKINSELVSIKVTRLPDKLNYICRKAIDATGGKVRLEYQNGLLFETDMEPFIKLGYDRTTPGQSKITVEYKGKSDSFYVNYTEEEEVEDEIINVYWGGMPQKTVYYLGDDLTVSDAYMWVVTLHEGRFEWKDYVFLTEDMCSGYDLSKTGEQTVTVTYEGFTLTFKIWVSDLILENEQPAINAGKSTRIDAYFSPKTGTLKTLNWSSSDNSVATVDKYGLVRGISEGSAVITAKVAGAVLSSSCTVTVTDEDIRVTGIHLSDTAKTLNLESRAQLTATVEPDNAANKNVTWSSGDEDVATVDENGLVTAVGTGTAEITVETEDGGYTATCVVTVAGSLDVRVTGISLNKNKLILGYKATEQLTAEVQPNNASDKSVIWSSSNSDVASVDQNGVVTGVSRGIATITARTADGDFAAVCELEVKFQWWQWILWVLMIGFLWY